MKEKNYNTEVDGAAKRYMVVFYSVAILVMVSMCFQFYGINATINEAMKVYELGEVATLSVSVEKIIEINESIPYDILIYALIMYCLGMFGIEGTRSLIISMELSGLSEKAKNMPKYKRDRLFQMLISFIILAVFGMFFKIYTLETERADFHLNAIFLGIGVFLSLLAYSDFAPKLGKELLKFKKEKEESKKE